MDVRVGLWRKLSAEELMLLNCGVGEDSWESLGLQGDPISHSKGNLFWIFIGRTDIEAETPILWPPGVKNWLSDWSGLNQMWTKPDGYHCLGNIEITADGDCSHERCLLLGRKAMTNLDSILKSRDISLPTKVHLVKAMVFPVVMYGCESWTIKKAEHRRINSF